MKSAIFLTVGLCVAGSAWAGEPVDAGALGGVDAAIAFCSKVNPAGAAVYGKLRHSAVGADVEPQDLDEAVQSKAYREAYDAAMKSSAAQSHDAAVKGCSELASPKPRRATSPHPAAKPVAPKPATPKPTTEKPPASGP